MSKRPFKNQLNDLTTKEWLKFQKSWFIHNPPPRKKGVLRHPAKFPETLAQEFIEFFTKEGQTVLDPMVGTGSTLVAAMRTGRHSYGIELNPGYAEIARQVVDEERMTLGESADNLIAEVITGNAADFGRFVEAFDIPKIDYVVTSPPYWDMLHARGAQTQKERRTDENLDVFYSDDPHDLGNEHDYARFLDKLALIYEGLQPFIRERAYLTIIVKNVKKGGKIYPLAWDLGWRLGKTYTLKDEKIWCLPPGERIWTSAGLRQIETIQSGAKVLTHTGRLERVTRTMQRHYAGKLLSIKPAMIGTVTQLTPEHEVLAIRRKQYQHKDGTFFHENFERSYHRGIDWIPAGDLNIGDAVAFPVSKTEITVVELETAPYLPRANDWHEEGDWYLTRWRGKHGRGRIPKNIPIDESFLRLAGWYLAGGSSSISGLNIANTSLDVQNEVAKLLQQVFDVHTKISLKGVWCRSRTLARLFENLFGKGAHNKYIPDFLLHIPLTKQKYLLQTLWAGDGHIGKDGLVTYKTVSEKLAYAIIYLSARFGVMPYLQHTNNWFGLTYRGSDAKGMLTVLDVNGNDIQHRRSQHWIKNGLIWLPIREIRPITYDGLVFNLEVENANSYTTNGFVVHNCQDNQRLAPYGMGNAWVSNTFHHYCLQFRNE
jgi:DNA modification methylase